MKLRERVTLGASALAVLLTLGIVLDLQLDLGVTTGRRLRPAAHRLLNTDASGGHARQQYGDAGIDAPRAVYNQLRRRFLERTNSSSSAGAAVSTGVGGAAGTLGSVQPSPPTVGANDVMTSPSMADQFLDLREVLTDPDGGQDVVVRTYEDDEANPTLVSFLQTTPK
ncbi:Protein of unknown function (DUF1193) [Nesidiocoris tenuis]|nr:Protein of unknown function (DUF1193) [Nesidiocoris tenuis]